MAIRPTLRIYRRSGHSTRTSATYDDITLQVVEEGHYVHVQSVAMWEPLKDKAHVVFYITTLGEDYPVVRIEQADRNAPHSAPADFWLRGGDILAARFYEGASTDGIHAYVYGVEYSEALEEAV